ncbi:MAG: rod shape-determining protein MreC [Melioribacteraceae bacterium]|nr:rod shape-determining protein MreC [Melioribacteraceae bacterium]
MKSGLMRYLNSFKQYILLALLLLLSLFLISTNKNHAVKNIQSILFGNFALINYSVRSLFSKQESDELLDQRKLNAELMLENTLMKSRIQEDNTLRDMLDFKKYVEYPLFAAQVISKTGSIFKGQFIIDAGSSSGIKNGMPVLTAKGLVGVVTGVSDEFSVIDHLFNSQLNVAVKIVETNIEGILNWNGSELIIRNIPTTYDIRPGFQIVTSDFSTIFPPKINVGSVLLVKSSVAGVLSEVVIDPGEDIGSVGTVFVMLIENITSLSDVDIIQND